MTVLTLGSAEADAFYREHVPGVLGNPFIPHWPHPKQEEFLGAHTRHDYSDEPIFRCLYGGAAGGGKLSPVDTPVLTPKGWRAIGELRVGDSVTDPTTGGSTKVVAVHPQGAQDIYLVTMDDGAAVEVGLEHLWAFKRNGHVARRPGTKAAQQRSYAVKHLGTEPRAQDRWATLRVGDTAELIALLERGERPRIPLTEPVSFTVNGRTGKGVLEPYFVGVYLGDGCHSGTVTTVDSEVREYLLSVGCSQHADPKSFGICGELRRAWRRWLYNHKLDGCRAWEKFVPDYVLTAPIDYRLEVLQGLMDTDGTVDARGRCSFTSTSRRLAEGVRDLVRGLGGKASIRERVTSYTHKGEKLEGRPSYTVSVWMRRTSSLFRLSRKRARCTDSWNGGHELMRAVVSIEKVRRAEAVCITVSNPLGLYVTTDYIVTHNSDALLMAAAQYAWKYPHFRGVLIRRTHAELMKAGALISRALQWWPGQGVAWDGSNKIFRFPNGATVEMGYHANPVDDGRYQGGEWHFVGFDELTHWPDGRAFEWLMSRIRKNVSDPIPLRLVAASNPGSVGHTWVKEYFVGGRDIATGQKIVPQAPYIRATIADNPSLDRDAYVKTLMHLHPTTRAQLLEGDWDAREPGDYYRTEWFGPMLDPELDAFDRKERIAIRWWDLAASVKEDAARTAGVLMSRHRRGVRAVEHATAFRLTPGARDARILQQAQVDGRDVYVGLEIEGGSGGPAQFETLSRMLRAHGFRVVGAKPKAELSDREGKLLIRTPVSDVGKAARAAPVASCLERGHQRRGECPDSGEPWWGTEIGVAVHDQTDGIRLFVGPWTQPYLDEIEGFPDTTLKDLADATNGAWAWLEAHPFGMSPGSTEREPDLTEQHNTHPEDRDEPVTLVENYHGLGETDRAGRWMP